MKDHEREQKNQQVNDILLYHWKVCLGFDTAKDISNGNEPTLGEVIADTYTFEDAYEEAKDVDFDREDEDGEFNEVVIYPFVEFSSDVDYVGNEEKFEVLEINSGDVFENPNGVHLMLLNVVVKKR